MINRCGEQPVFIMVNVIDGLSRTAGEARDVRHPRQVVAIFAKLYDRTL
jgi:hypothetical protein